MNPIKNIKDRIRNGLKMNLLLSIYAVIIAIFAWFIISMTKYPSIPKTIDNIPLNIDITGSVAAENGLSLISCNIDSVNVQILGNRAQIGNLDSENLTAKIVVTNITTAGTKELAIEISSDNQVEFQVQSISPATATVVFDKYETREFPITPQIPNITFAEGKTIYDDDFTCEPEVINITGPAAQLDKISKCVAISNKEMELSSSYTVASDEIALYSEDGTTLDQSSLKLNSTNFILNIPVLTQKTVGLSVGIYGAPSNFDTSFLKFDLSADSITVASKNNIELSDIPDPIKIGEVTLSELVLDYTKTFEIDTKDYINMSNLDTVTVKLDSSNLDSKDITLSYEQLSIINQPNDFDFDVLAQKLDITVIGPADIIEDITANDIVANINLLNATIPQTDTFSYPVTITCPNFNNVWAVTNAKVTIQKSEKVEATTGSTSKNS